MTQNQPFTPIPLADFFKKKMQKTIHGFAHAVTTSSLRRNDPLATPWGGGRYAVGKCRNGVAKKECFLKSHCSVKMTCTMVWPTAFSVFLSMWLMSSAMVCQVGPKLLCWHSG